MIIVDTGLWVGLANIRGQHHADCRQFAQNNREPLITTYPVLVETIHLLFNRVAVPMTLAWLETVQSNGLSIFDLTAAHLLRVTQFMRHRITYGFGRRLVGGAGRIPGTRSHRFHRLTQFSRLSLEKSPPF